MCLSLVIRRRCRLLHNTKVSSNLIEQEAANVANEHMKALEGLDPKTTQALQSKTPRMWKRCMAGNKDMHFSPAQKLPFGTFTETSSVSGPNPAAQTSGTTPRVLFHNQPQQETQTQPSGAIGTVVKGRTIIPGAVHRTPHSAALNVKNGRHTRTGKGTPLPPSTPFRTTHYSSLKISDRRTNLEARDAQLLMGERLDIPKVDKHVFPSKEKNLVWDGSLGTVFNFIERMEGWFPSVRCEALLDRGTLDYYAQHGMDVFVETFGLPNGDPYCNVPQLNHTVNFLYSVLSTGLNKSARALVRRYRNSHDGWLVWHAFLKQFEKQGINTARSVNYMEAISLHYADMPKHNAAALYEFVNRFDNNMTYLCELDDHWDDISSRRHFLTMVSHETTAWLIDQAERDGLSYYETISLFRATAGRSLRPSMQHPSRNRAQTVSLLDTNLAVTPPQEPFDPVDAVELHPTLVTQRDGDQLRIANPLWSLLDVDTRTKITEARRQLQQQQSASTSSSPTLPNQYSRAQASLQSVPEDGGVRCRALHRPQCPLLLLLS